MTMGAKDIGAISATRNRRGNRVMGLASKGDERKAVGTKTSVRL